MCESFGNFVKGPGGKDSISVLNFCFTLNAEIVLSEDDRPEALGDFRTSEILCRCLASGRVSAHDQSD